MRYEDLGSFKLPKVGFGTWSIGGGSTPDRSRDPASLAALRSAIELGYTHFDTAESYADGHCEELIGAAIRDAGIDREAIFLTSKVKPEHLAPAVLLKACDDSLRRLRTDYLDLYLVHWPSRAVKLEDTFRGLNQLVRVGKVRHLGVSNFDLELLKRAQNLAETPIATDQIPYSVMERSYVHNGVLAHCQQNNIVVTAYSPLEQRGLRMGRGLAEVARERAITVHQAAIAWLCSQPRVITIPMSMDPQHQRENLEASEIVLSAAELARVN